MRRPVVLVVAVLALFAAVGCNAVPIPFRRSAPAPPAIVDVHLTLGVTEAQTQQVGDTLKRVPGVRSVMFQTPEQAYERAKKVFKDKPEVLKNVRPDAFPASYIVRLTDRGKAKRVVAAVTGMPGVEDARLRPVAQPS